MPKISSNNHIRINNNKFKIDESVDVHYNKDYHFYVKVPEKYWPQFDMLELKDRPYTRTKEKPSWKSQGNISERERYIVGSTEAEVLENTKKILEQLANVGMQETQVILIDYTKKLSEDTYNYSLPEVGVELTINYATEVRIAGGEPKYYRYHEYEAFNEKRVNRNEVTTVS